MKPAAALSVWVLLVQSVVFCCAPAAAVTGDKNDPAVEHHCHHESDRSPAVPDKHNEPACCTDVGAIAAQQSNVKSAAQQPAPDFGQPAVMPATLFEAAGRSSRQLFPPNPDPVRRSRPYYLSYCVFLE